MGFGLRSIMKLSGWDEISLSHSSGLGTDSLMVAWDEIEVSNKALATMQADSRARGPGVNQVAIRVSDGMGYECTLQAGVLGHVDLHFKTRDIAGSRFPSCVHVTLIALPLCYPVCSKRLARDASSQPCREPFQPPREMNGEWGIGNRKCESRQG